MSDVPLPVPFHGFYGAPMYSADQMHAHAAAVSAAENARQRKAIRHYEAALKEAWLEGAKGKSFEHWNTARIAVQGSQP
jgi:hypothetical protein